MQLATGRLLSSCPLCQAPCRLPSADLNPDQDRQLCSVLITIPLGQFGALTSKLEHTDIPTRLHEVQPSQAKRGQPVQSVDWGIPLPSSPLFFAISIGHCPLPVSEDPSISCASSAYSTRSRYVARPLLDTPPPLRNSASYAIVPSPRANLRNRRSVAMWTRGMLKLSRKNEDEKRTTTRSFPTLLS